VLQLACSSWARQKALKQKFKVSFPSKSKPLNHINEQHLQLVEQFAGGTVFFHLQLTTYQGDRLFFSPYFDNLSIFKYKNRKIKTFFLFT
jgi:hypothetical protein